jgi:hypothetical protein
MSSKNLHQHSKVRLTVECSLDERTFIKMLAAKKQLTISELLLSSVRNIIPQTKQPNAETVKALKESRKRKLKSYKNLDEFWTDMGIDPNA